MNEVKEADHFAGLEASTQNGVTFSVSATIANTYTKQTEGVPKHYLIAEDQDRFGRPIAYFFKLTEGWSLDDFVKGQRVENLQVLYFANKDGDVFWRLAPKTA